VQPSPDDLAAAVVETVALAVAPVLERVAAVETTLRVIGDLRDRVVAVEVKAAQPADLGDVRDRLAALDVKAAGVPELQQQLEARLVALEARAPIPGPAGPQGERGERGERGEAGDPGTRDDLTDDDLTALCDDLTRKTFSALPPIALPVRMQKRVIRDRDGRIARIVEEPVAP